MAIILKHQTTEAFIARIRAAYRDGDPAVVIKIARFIITRIQAGDFTDAQFRTAYSLTANQWNNLKTKMQNFITAANLVEAAQGE